MKRNGVPAVFDKLIPYVLLPAVIGVFTGVLIFIFKVSSGYVMDLSAGIYSFVREEPRYIPLLILGVAAVGLFSALILRLAKECRGGGIPTAIASIRGLIPIKWVQGIFALFFTAQLTYLAGVPLGNEGPSVQMGTALGKGASEVLGKKKRAWERFIMTGGGSSGFAIATGAPMSGIVFALEEAHRRFSPAIISVVSVSVISGIITQEILSFLFGVDTTFFNLTIDDVLPFEFLWVAVLVGILCGISSIFFALIYRDARRLERGVLSNLPFSVKIVGIFVISGILGVICEDFIGSGHGLIEKILHRESLWYVLIISFVIRAALMIFASNQGVSGGLFVPTLAFGAIISALVAEGFISIGLLGEEYFSIIVVVGMASSFSAFSRTPITALTFAAEALCVANNILPAAVGVTFAYLVVELFEKESFTDEVIESKIEKAHRGKQSVVVDKHMSVGAGSVAEGKNHRNILWPPTCVVLSIVKKSPHTAHDNEILAAGDVLHLHYRTYDPEDTEEILIHILGAQPEDSSVRITCVDEDHVTPLE